MNLEDDSFKELKEVIGEYMNQREVFTKQFLPDFKKDVDCIVTNNITNENTIDHKIEELLEYCFDDDILLEFKRLLRYYYKFNIEAVAFYVKLYREQWDDDYEEE